MDMGNVECRAKGRGYFWFQVLMSRQHLLRRQIQKKKIPRLQGRKKIAACPTMTNQDRAVNTAGIVKDRKNWGRGRMAGRVRSKDLVLKETVRASKRSVTTVWSCREMQNDFQLIGASWHYVRICDYVEGGEKWGMRGQLIPLWSCKQRRRHHRPELVVELLRNATLNLGHVGHASSHNV